MDHIRRYISNGATIKWVGYYKPQHVWVHLFYEGHTIKEIIKLKEDYTQDSFKRVKALAAASPGSVSGTIWSSDSRLDLLRLASILGLNPGASASPGISKAFNGIMGCTMAYDIEQDRSRLPLSSFPTPSESIKSIATYCSCGDVQLFSFIPGVQFDYILCTDSRDTVSKFMEYVKRHSPQWLVGYNNFRYDNTCLAFHADPKFDNVFISMKMGAGSSLSYAFYIDIEGVYNIDLLTYLDKTRRSMYTNMSLATLVKHHEVGQKMDFDTADDSSFLKLFEYNVHDSKITMELARASGVIVEITSLAVVTCSTIIDCVRFVSGRMAACLIASYCLEHRICMDWSPASIIKEYKGAEVLTPIVGLHENVTSCDFSSMYPTIVIGANISIENYREQKRSMGNGATSSNSIGTVFTIDDIDIVFNREKNAIVPAVMKLLVEKRKEVRKSNPSYALGLKIAANSIYGSIGDKNSPVYSPSCSASVTAGGRWCLATAEVVLRALGYRVVYGDTDSCFVAPYTNAKGDIHIATRILSRIFQFTPFPGMSMEVENNFSKIAFLGKKTYFGKIRDGAIISKGMSKSRKDRIGICRTFTSIVVPVILADLTLRMKQTVIGDMLNIIVDNTVGSKLTLEQISKIVKRAGSNYFEYRRLDGKRDWKECESSSGHEIVPYSSMHICKSIKNEIESVLAVTSMGSMATVMRSADVI